VVLAPEIDDDDGDVVGAAPRERQLGEQRGGLGAPLLPAPAEAGARHLAGGLVADHVPQPVAGQDQALVAVGEVGHRHLGHRAHVRLEVPIPDGAGHGQDAQHARALPEDDPPARGLDPLLLVGAVGLVVRGQRDGRRAVAPAAEHRAGVAAVGHHQPALLHHGHHGGGPHVVALVRVAPAAGAGRGAPAGGGDLGVHPREAPLHRGGPGRGVPLRRRAFLVGAGGQLLGEQLVHPVPARLGDVRAAVAVEHPVEVAPPGATGGEGLVHGQGVLHLPPAAGHRGRAVLPRHEQLPGLYASLPRGRLGRPGRHRRVLPPPGLPCPAPSLGARPRPDLRLRPNYRRRSARGVTAHLRHRHQLAAPPPPRLEASTATPTTSKAYRKNPRTLRELRERDLRFGAPFLKSPSERERGAWRGARGLRPAASRPSTTPARGSPRSTRSRRSSAGPRHVTPAGRC
jgi:hypothetical protein